MNKEKQKPALSGVERIVPKLRFPEFKDDGEWIIEPLNDVYSFKITNSFSRDKLNYDNGSVKNIHYGDIHTKFSTHFDILKEDVPFINPETSINRVDKDNYCIEGDLVIADASEDIDDIGKSIEIINLNKEKLLAGLHTFLARPIDSKITIGFGGHLFKSSGIVTQIKKEAQGAKVLGISKGRLANLDVYYPKNPKEQQKIADCLSSLDEVINAETEKRDLLQEHKKGLLQQLFPVEGETQPKFRFAEFKDDGDWVRNKVSSVCEKPFSGGTPTSTKKEYYGGEIPFIRSAEINREKTELFITQLGFENSAAKMVDIGDVLVAMYGANSGDVGISKIKGAINQAILCLRSKTNNVFLYHYLGHKKNWIIQKYIQGGQGNLSGDIIKSVELFFPPNPKEQQKIADCLSTVDALIAAQEQRIEKLQAHKKGLMQQLFPKIER